MAARTNKTQAAAVDFDFTTADVTAVDSTDKVKVERDYTQPIFGSLSCVTLPVAQYKFERFVQVEALPNDMSNGRMRYMLRVLVGRAEETRIAADGVTEVVDCLARFATPAEQTQWQTAADAAGASKLYNPTKRNPNG